VPEVSVSERAPTSVLDTPLSLMRLGIEAAEFGMSVLWQDRPEQRERVDDFRDFCEFSTEVFRDQLMRIGLTTGREGDSRDSDGQGRLQRRAVGVAGMDEPVHAVPTGHTKAVRRFRWENDEFHVFDVGSLNSTYVNREPVDSAVLVNGDEIQIGKFRLTFLTKPKNHGDARGTHDWLN
jgi:hypothetical protein